MRHVMTISAAAFAAVISLAGSVSANEPCKTCGNGVTPTLAPKPKCDNKIYPLSEYHYYKRYCGPVISPNATYGYFQTQWRPWDGGQVNQNANCATAPKVEAPAAPAAPAVVAPVAPETKTQPAPLKVMPPPTGKEPIPAPSPSPSKGSLNRIGTAGPVSPGVYLLPSNQ